MYTIIGKNILSHWAGLDPNYTSDDINDIIPPAWWSNVAAESEIDSMIVGKTFELHERKEEFTLAFQINTMIDSQSFECYYRAEMLDSAVEILEDNSIRHTFL